jgi:uncharacterized protein YlxW (UPF0749 family)
VSLAVWIAIAIAVLAVLLLLLVLMRLVGPLRQLQAQVFAVEGKLDDIQALQARVDQINGALSDLQERAGQLAANREAAGNEPVRGQSAQSRGSAA